MKSIGFKNFRKFVEFPPMEFNDITLMVGRNNSGKSTLVKATLIALNFLKYNKANLFGDNILNFDNNFFYDINIGTFSRALCNDATRNEITFNVGISDYKFDIFLVGNSDDKNSTNATVTKINIYDGKRGINANFDFTSASINIEFENRDIDTDTQEKRNNLSESIKLQDQKLQETIELTAIDEIQSQIKSLKKGLNSLKSSISSQQNNKIQIELNTNHYEVNETLIWNLLNILNKYTDDQSTFIDQRSKKYKDDIEAKKTLSQYSESLSKMHAEICNSISDINIEYIPAYDIKKSVYYSSKDTNDYIADTIHSYFTQKDDIEARQFVISWMKELGIGYGFEIESFGGEVHTLSVIDEKKHSVYLTDKGTGSIRLMILLLRIATIINKYKSDKITAPIVFIEEPELNLHPDLQSKLAELLEYVNKKIKIKFIVETHSEYLIRKSQVLVAQKDYKDEKDLSNNIFSTFYFKSDGMPYQMIYRTDGKFSNEFETGFFDETNNLIFEIL